MRAWLLIGLIVALSCTAACSRRTGGVHNEHGWRIGVAPTALTTGPTTLTITLHDGGGAPIDRAALAVRGDMTHAGMVPVLAESLDDGRAGVYQVPFEWTMKGDWIVTVTITLPDGATAAEQFRFTVQ